MVEKIKFNPDLESEGGKLYRQYCEEKGIEYSITAGANFCLGYMAVKPNQGAVWVKASANDKIRWGMHAARYINDDDGLKYTGAAFVEHHSITFYSHLLGELKFGKHQLDLVNLFLLDESGTAAGREEDWVDVNDRLPEEGGRYWCYVEEITDLGRGYFQWNCAYNQNGKLFTDKSLCNGERITHWRPLPEPPKFKQQKEK